MEAITPIHFRKAKMCVVTITSAQHASKTTMLNIFEVSAALDYTLAHGNL